MLLFLRGVGFESRILGSDKSFDCHVFQQLDFPMWILEKEFRNNVEGVLFDSFPV